jgi:3-isopropylmalate/(R)-2-methylmalate dehydratase small subunit
MNALDVVRGPAAFLRRANVDTDSIIRLDRMRENAKEELGRFALETLRFDTDGRELPDFVLNDDKFRHAPFLLAGPNFGCGSSREGAVWALKAYGIRCIVAPSYGDIFFGNCFQNAVLPVVMSREDIESLASVTADGQVVELDLREQRIQVGDYHRAFEIDPLNKSALLAGTDPITETRKMSARIGEWQAAYRLRRPWTVPAARD